MTATQLQSIALRLGNAGWCRHWLNLNNSHDNVLMAIQVLEARSIERGEDDALITRFTPTVVPDLEKLGFELLDDDQYQSHIYTIRRTNDDGTPYTSQLF